MNPANESEGKLAGKKESVPAKGGAEREREERHARGKRGFAVSLGPGRGQPRGRCWMREPDRHRQVSLLNSSAVHSPREWQRLGRVAFPVTVTAADATVT